MLALLGLDQPEEGLAALRAGLACAPTESDLYYALQDLLILARVPRAIPGLNEAIQVLRKEWEAGGGLGALATVLSENEGNVWAEAVRDQVFISYAHEDNESPDPNKRWLDRLLQQLEPLRVQGQVSTWSDRDIDIGEDWHERIQASLMQTKAAVLLVSPAFLASKYIRNSELPALLKNAKDNGVVILPLILRPCLFTETKFKYPDPVKGPQELTLSNLQSANSPDKPLNALSEYEQDQVLFSVAQRLLQLTQLNPQ